MKYPRAPVSVKQLYKKFVCYCTTNKGELSDEIAAAETKGPETAAAIEESANEKTQLQADLKAHKADRASAKKSVADAKAIREKEAKAYADSTSELNANSAVVFAMRGVWVKPVARGEGCYE